MDDGGGGGDSNMYNFSSASAYDPFTLADVLNSKTAAVVSRFEEASATPPSSVVAVEAETTIREALDELAVSEVRALPVRDKETGVVLGFFDATQALAVALAAAGGTESERTVLEQPVSSLIDPRFDAGRRGDGGTLPFACADLPLRELMSDSGHLMYEQHGVIGGTPVGSAWWFQADVHRLAVVDSRALRVTTTLDDVTVESTIDRSAAGDASRQPQPPQHPNPSGGGGGFVTTALRFEEVVDIISQVDVVRCLVDAYDHGYPPDHHALRLALEESVAMHASQPFGTFEDAPAGAALAEMLRRGYGAAVVVVRSKHTIEHAADDTVWRAVDTLSCSDFRDIRDVSLLRPLEDGGANVAKFCNEARGSGERRLDAVGESASMYDAARLMVTLGVHRAWVIGVGGVPVGCVSATDVLRCVGSVHRRTDSLSRMQPVPIVETPSA